mmetsp:Transcript_1983/g.2818  ORF Transcript_1983/g.2818 Transcript_1983/m.2818 type:complete len:341 (+) Transcript_1983:36-1058(+)
MISGEQDWITKCPCGQNQDPDGLMIQCDSCLVWQHGDCVGLFSKESVPDQYFCEACKPQHKIHQEARRRRAEVTQARQIRIARARGRMKAGVEKERVGRKPKKTSRGANKRPKQTRNRPPLESPISDSSNLNSRSSREQRKLERILESFKRLDEKEKKKSSRENPAERKKEHRDNGIRESRKRRGRPRRNKRKPERPPPAESQGVLPVEKLVALSPMYLGRKAWLLRSYRKDQLLQRYTGFEHLVKEENLPLKKRMLMNFVADHKERNGHSNGAENGTNEVVESKSNMQIDLGTIMQDISKSTSNGISSDTVMKINGSTTVSKPVHMNGHGLTPMEVTTT